MLMMAPQSAVRGMRVEQRYSVNAAPLGCPSSAAQAASGDVREQDENVLLTAERLQRVLAGRPGWGVRSGRRQDSLEIQIPFAVTDTLIIGHELRVELWFHHGLDFQNFRAQDRIADFERFLRGKIIQPFAEGENRIQLAEFTFLAGFQHIHNAAAGGVRSGSLRCRMR